MRCIPNIRTFLAPLETIILTRFLLNLTGQPSFNDAERKLFALPARLGILVWLILHSIPFFSFLHQLQLLLLWFGLFCSSLLLPLLMFCVINWRLSDVLLTDIISLSLTLMTLCCHCSPHLCADLFCYLVNLALQLVDSPTFI